jgi:hypothetical protein
LLGDNRIEGHVPGLRFDDINALAFVRKADEARPQPVPPRAKKGQRAIVISCSHADSVAVAIESDEGHDDQVEPLRYANPPTPAGGLYDTVTILPQRRVGKVADKPQSSVCVLAQNRKVPLAAARESPADWCRVDLPVPGSVERDTSGALGEPGVR